MGEFINTIDVLGDDAVTDSIIERTIESFTDDVVTTIGVHAFSYCESLKSVNLPMVTRIGSFAFFYCESLKSVNLPMVTSIGDKAFRGCSSLVALILRSETMVTIFDKWSIGGTPIASGTGYVYVPRALLSDDDATKDYRRATNWTTYANQFRALEDYTVDGTITGELDPNKI